MSMGFYSTDNTRTPYEQDLVVLGVVQLSYSSLVTYTAPKCLIL